MKKFKLIAIVACLFMLAGIVPVFAETTEIGTRAVSGFPVYGKGQAGSMKVAYGTVGIPSTIGDGYIYQLCRIPANATVLGGMFYASDLDTGTEELDLDVGWASNGVEAADPDGLLDGGIITGDAVTGIKPETGTAMPFGGVLLATGPKKFSAETVIQVEGNAAPDTFAAGTISVEVYYTMD
jgi:hypothetical protein